jgi:sortase A
LARSFSWLLIGLGAFALLDAGVTMVWQEPLSALYATIQQNELSSALQALEDEPIVGAEAHNLSLLHHTNARIALLARHLERTVAEGNAVGRIQIPRIGVNYVLVYGTSTSSLEKGPGIYSGSVYPLRSFPGLRGTTAIAGHRTTFLAPFRHINELRAGDEIVVTMPYGRFTYTVMTQRSVVPTDIAAVVQPAGYPRLVLSACTPPFSAAERLLVYARLTQAVPLGAARLYTERLIGRWDEHSLVAAGIGLPQGGLRTRFIPSGAQIPQVVAASPVHPAVAPPAHDDQTRHRHHKHRRHKHRHRHHHHKHRRHHRSR